MPGRSYFFVAELVERSGRTAVAAGGRRSRLRSDRESLTDVGTQRDLDDVLGARRTVGVVGGREIDRRVSDLLRETGAGRELRSLLGGAEIRGGLTTLRDDVRERLEAGGPVAVREVLGLRVDPGV